MSMKKVVFILSALLIVQGFSTPAFARDIEYKDVEVTVRVAPNEPTQIQFPSAVAGGFKKKVSSLSLEPKETDLVVFAGEGLSESGEAIIVRLKDGRSYSMRVARATAASPRDSLVKIIDGRTPVLGEEEIDPAYREKKFDYAPPSQVSGLLREMALVAEFGKNSISGYRASDSYRGQTVLNDGAIHATIDTIFMGPNLWGYVLDAENMLDQTQKINPSSFRIDGTRAISAKEWELSPVPITAEQQVAATQKTKVYIVTKARK
jgi:hypothetical protein